MFNKPLWSCAKCAGANELVISHKVGRSPRLAINHDVRHFDAHQIMAIITSDSADKDRCLLKTDTVVY